MDKIWKRATRFLSESETRIRVENQRIQGEDYLVWRWIQVLDELSSLVFQTIFFWVTCKLMLTDCKSI